MTQSKKIAVTGGIGSGKSRLLQILQEKGYSVYSCDEIYRELSQEKEYLDLLSERFPECVQGGVLDRKALSQAVFENQERLAVLNGISHPLIMTRMIEKMQAHAVCFAEVPLLFEGGFEGLFDGVIALRRGQEERLNAVMQRDGLSQEEALSRMATQFDPTLLEGKECIVIENDGSLKALQIKLENALARLGVI